MRRLAGLLLIGTLSAVAACAPRTIPLPVVTTPRFPEFIQPVVPAELSENAAVIPQARAWTFLQAGDTKNAEREAAEALRVSPGFFPSEAISGYVDLAQKNAKSALTHFDRALDRERSYVPALVGRGQSLLALDREADAIAPFEAAVAADPALTDIQRRVEVLKFRVLERNLAAARDAARGGRVDDALRLYRAALVSSPESAFLYRELGAIERQRGEQAAALEHFRKALELDPTDAGSLSQVAELLDAQGDIPGALAAYDQALNLEPGAALEARRDALRARAELAGLPEEYRAIPASPQVSRGALAALIGVRLAPLLEGRQRDVGVVTDLRGSWAEAWILPVLRAGVMEAFANHTFQPTLAVRRVDLAQVISRLLSRAASLAPQRAAAWQNARGRFPDLAPGHVAYPAASVAVAAGVMIPDPDGSFQPSRAVNGAEAMAAIDRIQALTSPRGAPSTVRP